MSLQYWTGKWPATVANQISVIFQHLKKLLDIFKSLDEAGEYYNKSKRMGRSEELLRMEREHGFPHCLNRKETILSHK